MFRSLRTTDELMATVWALFSQASPLLYLVAAVEVETDRIVGHAMGDIRKWDGKMVGWIGQVEMDQAAGRELVDAFLTHSSNWVHSVNQVLQPQGIEVDTLIMCTPRMTDAWARHAGFEPYRVLLKREVL